MEDAWLISPTVPDEAIWHVEPINDLRDHDCGRDQCWCKPLIEETAGGYIIVHNSMDGREKFETGERKPS